MKRGFTRKKIGLENLQRSILLEELGAKPVDTSVSKKSVAELREMLVASESGGIAENESMQFFESARTGLIRPLRKILYSEVASVRKDACLVWESLDLNKGNITFEEGRF